VSDDYNVYSLRDHAVVSPVNLNESPLPERGLIPEFISRIYLINVDTMDTLYWAMVIFLKGGKEST
jgi:hypothetical protein